MKKTLFRFLLVGQVASAALSLSACNDLLEPTPVQQLPDSQAIKDAGSARAATIGVYGLLIAARG